MKIKVGSQNQTKIIAVEDTLRLYPALFPNPEVFGIDTGVALHGHPKNLAETVQGAVDRAIAAYQDKEMAAGQDCDLSFGLEGGLMEVPLTRTGYMEVGACAVYDGSRVYLGLSPAFEWPPEVTKMILNGQADASLAFKELGYTDQDKLGAQPGGVIGFLTKQALTREEYTRYSIIMALVQIENPQFYPDPA